MKLKLEKVKGIDKLMFVKYYFKKDPLFQYTGDKVLLAQHRQGIRLLRKRIERMSIENFAEMIGYSPRTVEGWEQGREISKGALQTIKDVFKL